MSLGGQTRLLLTTAPLVNAFNLFYLFVKRLVLPVLHLILKLFSFLQLKESESSSNHLPQNSKCPAPFQAGRLFLSHCALVISSCGFCPPLPCSLSVIGWKLAGEAPPLPPPHMHTAARLECWSAEQQLRSKGGVRTGRLTPPPPSGILNARSVGGAFPV